MLREIINVCLAFGAMLLGVVLLALLACHVINFFFGRKKKVESQPDSDIRTPLKWNEPFEKADFKKTIK